MVSIATLANGCFWCTEATLQLLKGVSQVTPGYTGGHTENPTYREVCSGSTGHAEAVKVIFDEQILSYEDLLVVYFLTHDPTTLNRQGGDVGTQYRSVIYTHSEDQKTTAGKVIEELTHKQLWSNPIVTEVLNSTVFYEAEDYHVNYFINNPGASYCTYVIEPKVAKLREQLLQLLK
jgi:peptide-methionine (S)-S-oxide reductase